MADINTIFTEILESQRDINTHIHELEPSSPIFLYEIDLNDIQPITINFGETSIFSDGVIRVHNDYNLFNVNRGIIIWKDKLYYPFPIFGEGFDITSNGSLPTPKIKFSSQFLEDQYRNIISNYFVKTTKFSDCENNFLLKRQDYKCNICNTEYVKGGFENDHIITKKINGSDCLANRQCLCSPCHKRIKNKLDPIFNEYIVDANNFTDEENINNIIKIKVILKSSILKSLINDISKDEAINYIQESFNIWRERSKHQWKLDISFIDDYIK